MKENMQRKPRGVSVHCSVPVCVRHPLVRRQALGTGRDPAARFSFLPSTGNSSLLPSQTDLGSPWSSPVWDRGAVSLPAIVAGGRRWPPTSSHSSTRWEGQPGDCVSRNSYLHFADIRKGLKNCFWQIWIKRSTPDQPVSYMSQNTCLQNNRCNRMNKSTIEKKGKWKKPKRKQLANLCPGSPGRYGPF